MCVCLMGNNSSFKGVDRVSMGPGELDFFLMFSFELSLKSSVLGIIRHPFFRKVCIERNCFDALFGVVILATCLSFHHQTLF